MRMLICHAWDDCKTDPQSSWAMATSDIHTCSVSGAEWKNSNIVYTCAMYYFHNFKGG